MNLRNSYTAVVYRLHQVRCGTSKHAQHLDRIAHLSLSFSGKALTTNYIKTFSENELLIISPHPTLLQAIFLLQKPQKYCF